MLTLPIGRVADPNRTGVRVPGEVRQLDLSPGCHLLPRIGKEREEVVGFFFKPQGVQSPEHERRVADPGVPVIPVAFSTRVSGSDVVAAASMAPVGAYESPFKVRALRCRYADQR